MNSPKEKMSDLQDLENYYIIKKLSTGWWAGSKVSPETRFVSNSELIRMGYLKPQEVRIVPPPAVSVITVPTGEKRRLDLNWRKKD